MGDRPDSYEAIVDYDAAPISILDRNVSRVADECGGRVVCGFCGYSDELKKIKPRKTVCRFSTKGERLRFIQAMRAFLKTADFGVEVTIE